MKIQVYNTQGNKEKETSTSIFDFHPIRLDIVQKICEVEKAEEKQPYSPFYLAGLQTSASGNVKHNRHVWKTDRGRGLSRHPKKRMSDKGDRFVWVAAVSPGVRGGSRAHPPKIIKTALKINKKEKELGIRSALAMVASVDKIKEKYSSLTNLDIKIKLPVVLDSKILQLKTKEFFQSIEKIFGAELINVALQSRETRAGVGKMRGRRYKKSQGLLFIIGNREEFRINGIEVINVNQLKIRDIASNGARLTMFTEEAVKELEKRLNSQGEKK